MRYFWREKNADSCKADAQVILPTRDELEEELIKKLEQKLDRITLIFDAAAREKYLSRGKRSSRIRIENLDKEEVQKEIGRNVIIDFMQTLKDLCEFYGMDFYALPSGANKASREEICSAIKEGIKNLFSREDAGRAIENIYAANVALAEMLKLDLEDIEERRAAIEQREGSFFKGKYVVFEN